MNLTMRSMILQAALVAIWPGIVHAQGVPESPVPARFSDPGWSRLQDLTNGRAIIVTTIDGRSVRCLFAGVNEAYLFCNPPGNPAGVGYRFDHAEVIGVDVDVLNHPQQAQAAPREHNYHPAWISSMIASGIVVGLVASQRTSAGRAAEDGLIGAGIVGLIGAPLAFMPRPQFAPPDPVYAPDGVGAQLRIPVRRRIHR